ncbi:MAG TPA: ActS/PrrB/RegB family redox-sensitive histidine kinase [Hyphomicrobiaceae bacterium]|nr:ActS/PrrB/RegB family redox-sensitive histidine kinase [Hyphomicrobiaceae bacterium]
MASKRTGSDDFGLIADADSRLKLQTIVRLRWIGVLGQVLAISVVSIVLGFELPVGPCLAFIAMSAWVNVYLAIRYPARYRLSVGFATLLLAYDIVQLAALLYLTGGIENPFTMLVVAPVTVSAATLPLRNTIALGALAMAATAFIAFHSLPLPWKPGVALDHPFLYKMGVLAAVGACMPFLALYAWRLTKESRQMSAALAATELILAREQKLHALDGLAAAAAHELGTPLSTIALVASELERELRKDSPLWDDIVLLRTQALRCREILQKLTRHPPEQDPLHASLPVETMLQEAAEPYTGGRASIVIAAHPKTGVTGAAAREPVGVRRPGVIFGLGNIIENAIDFADIRVEVAAEWDGATVIITIADDGPGFNADLIDNLGEPYVTTRAADARKRGDKAASGLGLFIAKTLLERSGARLAVENQKAPRRGAVVRITWPRPAFEASPVRGDLQQSEPPSAARVPIKVEDR